MSDFKRFEKLDLLVLQLYKAESNEEKEFILRKNEDLVSILSKILDKNFVFNITGEKVLEHYENFPEDKIVFSGNFESFLKALNSREISGKKALSVGAYFIDRYFMFEYLIVKILNKKLNCGIGEKTLNKVFPGSIHIFNVPLANMYKAGLVDFSTQSWYCSRKIDGVRCIAIKEKGKVELFSGKGKKFQTLNKIKRQLEQSSIDNVVLDGKICVRKKGKEDFNSTMKLIRRKNYQIVNPYYYIFDSFTIEAFKNKKDTDFFCRKYSVLQDYFPLDSSKKDNIIILDQTKIQSEVHLALLIYHLPAHYKGFMIRSNNPSVFKRSNQILKVKKFKEIDLYVIGTKNGTKKINGKEIFCLSSIIVKLENKLVSVGSGFSDEQRIYFYNNREKIVGKLVSIKYFEETKNKDNQSSLRFPVFKCVKQEI